MALNSQDTENFAFLQDFKVGRLKSCSKALKRQYKGNKTFSRTSVYAREDYENNIDAISPIKFSPTTRELKKYIEPLNNYIIVRYQRLDRVDYKSTPESEKSTHF